MTLACWFKMSLSYTLSLLPVWEVVEANVTTPLLVSNPLIFASPVYVYLYMTMTEQRSHEDQHLSSCPITFYVGQTALPSACASVANRSFELTTTRRNCSAYPMPCDVRCLVSQRQPIRGGGPSWRGKHRSGQRSAARTITFILRIRNPKCCTSF